MAKEINREFMINLIKEHKNLKTKKEKGEFINNLEKRYNIKRDCFYKSRKEYLQTNQVHIKTGRRDKGKPRVASEEQLRRDIKAIAAIKLASSLNARNDYEFFRNKKFNTTKQAIQIALSQGRISKKYPESTVNYWIRIMGLDYTATFRSLAAIRMKAEHSNHVWLGDATPSESIYLRENGRIVYDPSLAQDKNHGEDRIRKLKLKKVWMYFVVDKYSGAFVVRLYSGVNMGENPQNWIETYKYCMESRSDEKDIRIPVCGTPLNLYGDGGAMNNSIIEKFSNYFGINVEWHLPGNSRASGGVESKISAIKRAYEVLWNSAIVEREEFNSKFDSFKDFMNEWTIECNESRGFYSKYRLGLKHKEEITGKHILESLLEPEVKTVSEYGEISVGGKLYYIPNPNLNGTKVKITRKYPDSIYATDYLGVTHECTEELNEVVFGEYKSHKITEITRNQEEVYELAKQFKKTTSPDELMPSKVVPLRSKENAIYSVNRAVDVMLYRSNTLKHHVEDEVIEMFKEMFTEILTQNGKITDEAINRAVTLFIKDKTGTRG